MWAELKKLVKDCLTENNGTSYCMFRVCGAALVAMGLPAFVSAAVVSIVKTHTLDYVAFGTGFAAMMGSLGILATGVAIKQRSDS